MMNANDRACMCHDYLYRGSVRDPCKHLKAVDARNTDVIIICCLASNIHNRELKKPSAERLESPVAEIDVANGCTIVLNRYEI